jgi:hypothetical protein
VSKDSKSRDRWRQADQSWRDRPATYCVGCGYFRVAHGVHRDDCTAAEIPHRQALANLINVFDGRVRILGDEEQRPSPMPTGSYGYWRRPAPDDDDEPVDDDDDREPATNADHDAETVRYREAMAHYPQCGCGQPLWASVSIARGFCEACARRSS